MRAPALTRAGPRAAAIAAVLVLLGVSVVGATAADADPPASRPNVILLMTDDQTLEEMRALPRTASWIAGRGTNFTRAHISYPLCCPARATTLSGRYMHNTGVRGNSAPSGGWEAFRGGGTEARALPVWLRDAGYYTVQIGKYMNGYNGSPPPVPPGWDEWYGKYSEYDEALHGGRIYFGYRFLEDPPAVGGVPCPSGAPANPGEAFTCHYGFDADDYQTDVIRDKAVEAIHRLGGDVDPKRPFFLNVWFNAPHAPYVPAPRHAGHFASLPIETPAGSNENKVSDKPRFLRRLPKLGKAKLDGIVNRRRARLEMLLSVDEAVDAIAKALDEENELNNTYLIFVSDNGYFNGEHRIRQGKYLPHEPSTHVPLMISGPGIPAGGASEELVSNVDIAETIRQATGASAQLPQDGRTLLPFAANPSLRTTRPLLLEGDTGSAGIDDDGAEDPEVTDQRRLKKFRKRLKKQKRELRRRCARLKRQSPKRARLCFKRGVDDLEQEPTESKYNLRAPAYRALRTDRYMLSLYSTGEIELYDMRRDPNQLRSVHKGGKYKRIRKWMLARLNEVSDCAGARCSAEIGTEPRPRKKRKKKD
jgi:arylsulfatase A-like enzyme